MPTTLTPSTRNQIFGRYTVIAIVRHKQDKYQVAAQIKHPTKGIFYVPLEIARLAAGKDKWMRDIKCRCPDCGDITRVGDMECNICPTCYDAQESELDEADGEDVEIG